MSQVPTGSGASAATKPLKVIVFSGGFNWPIWVAQERGLFFRRGIAVEVATTPGSVFQWTRLAMGYSNLAISLLDNLVAYREGQGEVPVVVPDAIAVMAADTRVLPALVTLPEIRSYSDLKGRALSIDAVATGFALVLVAMLERSGLGKGDYELVRVGGVSERFEALKRREHAGALFNAPFTGQLKDIGFNILDTAASAVGAYQNHVVAVRRGWAERNRAQVVGFIRGFSDAVEWLYDPANRTEAFAIFERNSSQHAPDAAANAYAVLFDAETGFARKGEFDAEGIRQVLALRARYGTPHKRLGEADSYCDLSFLEEAMALQVLDTLQSP
jgi:ABC-type nitrate/sulfonate/bicarbonate transport system substrate-binding protein